MAKWIYDIEKRLLSHTEIEEHEARTMETVRGILKESSTTLTKNSTLSAAMLQWAADFYDDPWVWGGKLLPAMNQVFIPPPRRSFCLLRFTSLRYDAVMLRISWVFRLLAEMLEKKFDLQRRSLSEEAGN